MRLSTAARVSLPILLACLLIVPNVQAQTTTMTDFQAPSRAILQPDGFTRTLTISYTVTFSGLPSGSILGMGILYEGTQNFVAGSVTSTPDPCQSMAGTAYSSSAACLTSPKSSSGTEYVSFQITLNSTQQLYSLRAGAAMVTGGTYIDGSASHQDFTVSVTSTLDLTVSVPGAVTVTIDGMNQTRGPVSLSLTPSTHVISVPQIVPLTGNSRLVFDHWSDGSKQSSRTEYLTDDTSLVAVYDTQYTLTLTDPSAAGGGWYDQGSTAQFSVPSSEPLPGILGLLGGTQTFQGWYENGKLLSSSSAASITMNAPQVLSTQWAANIIAPVAIIIGIVLVPAAMIAFAVYRRRTATSETLQQSIPSSETPVPPTQGVEDSTQTEDPSAKLSKLRKKKNEMYCSRCGARIPRESRFCKECGAEIT